MATTGGLTTSARLHAAFSKALYQRCVSIKKLLDDTSTKELHSLLPILLESIFGFGSQAGWGIAHISKAQHYEYQAVHQLLRPDGPLLRLVHRLMADPYFRYEFPLSCIPFPSRALIEEGSIPALYADKVQCNVGGRPYSMLSLNAFEYYFFHFSYFLVNPQNAKPSAWGGGSTDTLFSVLLEQYLNFYLPLFGKNIPQAVATPQSGNKTPLTPKSPLCRPSTLASPGSRSTPTSNKSRLNLSGLFRGSGLASPYSPPPSSPMPEHSEPETGHSQAFLQVVVEFWLNQTSLDVDKYAISASMESFLPSNNHVRVVRMVVKHLHYFTNSAKSEVISSPYSSPTVSTWEDFKRMVFPHFVQKKLYAFLKHGFERWPLDASFRLILETWLSFLQPWRYTDPAQSNRERERDDSRDRLVDVKWQNFVADNLLFYTTLFNHFLQRALRMDLGSPKNAYMLFRGTKVFNSPNLREIIENVEMALKESLTRTPSSMSMSHSASGVGSSPSLYGSYLSPPGARHHGNLASAVQVHISELETSGFRYQSMFSKDTLIAVQHLLNAINQARQSIVPSNKAPDAANGSFLEWFGFGGSSADYNTSRYVLSEGYDDLGGGGDIRKLGIHLDQATDNLCGIFLLDPPDKMEKAVKFGSLSPYGSCSTPDVYESEKGSRLSPLGRYQMMNGLRKFDIMYEGDPELQPVRSFECAPLVRMLYCLSNYINTRFGAELLQYYCNTGWTGRIARQLLAPPSDLGSPDKMAAVSPHTQHQVELYRRPRLSLRWLANYQTLGYILFAYIALYMWKGCGPVGFLLAAVMGIVVIATFMAALKGDERIKID